MRNRRNVWITMLCVFALLLGLCSAGYAAEPAADFRYTEGKDGLTLTGYTGNAANLTIPAEIGGKAVTVIGDECFRGQICLRRVHIPEGVKTIGDYAFEACSALQRVYLPDSLTAIGDGAFSGCGHLTLADLQDNVKRIGRGAFLCCDALVNIELSEALTELGDFAFAGCESLARVTFSGDKLKAVPDRAFYGCSALTRVNLPESTESIGKRAFSGCGSLTSFYHGKPLSSLGEYAFEGCEKMTSLTVNAPTIPGRVFSGCSALEYLTVGKGVKTIDAMAFYNSGIKSVDLAATVTEIAPGAFYGASVTEVTAEDSPAYAVTDGALCSKDGKTLLAWFPADPYAEEPQTDFTVPDGVETIADYAFAFAPLQRITLPDSLKAIGAYAFANVQDLDMSIPEGVKVDPKAFDDPDAPEAGAETLAKAETAAAATVTTKSAAGDKSLYRETMFRDFRTIANNEFDAWCEEYLVFNETRGNPIAQDLIPYIMRYKGEVVPHFMAMTAVQNHDPDMWAQAASYFGDDFEQMYIMMNHGLFAELGRGKMQDNLVLYSGVYDSQLMAAAGTKTVPTQDQLIASIGNTFTDPVMISTTPDPAVACGFGDTLFIIYASQEAMEALGAVCMDAVVHSSENEILMAANAQYRVLDVGDMTVTHQEPGDETPVTEKRHYVRVELLGGTNPSNPFEDVADDAYYRDAAIWAVRHGVTVGVSETRFDPDGIATRAQVVTFLWRAAGEPKPTGSKNPFTDVKSSDYYYNAVLWAVEKGITQGTGKTSFSPNAPCTRAQVVTFLWRSEGQSKTDAKNPFTDVKDDAYYSGAVLWAVKNNITAGTSRTTFSPAKPCTRAQIVTFLYRCAG